MKTFEKFQEAKSLAAEHLNSLPGVLSSSGYQQGTVYVDGGFDFREVFTAPDGEEVEIFYSYTSNECLAVNKGPEIESN